MLSTLQELDDFFRLTVILFFFPLFMRDNQQSIFSVFGAMYTAVIVCGINNASSVLPYVTMERSVLYRERFAGMYAPWAYALAQVYIGLIKLA